MSYHRPKINMQSLNEKNPLNYVVPITVNLYFKKQNPGPDLYKPKKPSSEKYQKGHRCLFDSKTQREFIRQNRNDNFLKYNLNSDIIQSQTRGEIKPTSSFMPPTTNKKQMVCLYDRLQESGDNLAKSQSSIPMNERSGYSQDYSRTLAALPNRSRREKIYQ